VTSTHAESPGIGHSGWDPAFVRHATRSVESTFDGLDGAVAVTSTVSGLVPGTTAVNVGGISAAVTSTPGAHTRYVSAGVSENSAAKHVYRAPAVGTATACAAPEVVTSTHAESPGIGHSGWGPAFVRHAIRSVESTFGGFDGAVAVTSTVSGLVPGIAVTVGAINALAVTSLPEEHTR